MLDLKAEVEKVKHAARAIEGITKRQVGEFLVIEVSKDRARFKDKPYHGLDLRERKAFDDFLYLSNVAIGHPKIIYV